MPRDLVRIKHPKTKGEADVSPSTVEHWKSLGWEPVPAKEHVSAAALIKKES